MTKFNAGFHPQTCFWCSQNTKTPNSQNTFDYKPCPECQRTKFKTYKGILLMGVTEKPTIEKQPEIKNIGYPTGRWAIFSETIASHFNNGDNDMRKQHLGFVDDSLLQNIMQQAKRPTT